MKFNLLMDTGFWIALLDPQDDPKKTQIAEAIAEDIELLNIIIPYPTLYEFVNSKLSRRDSKKEFERIMRMPNVITLSDSKYKELALEHFFLKSERTVNDVSLVDEIIVLMLSDVNLKLDYIVSFDSGLINQASTIGIMQYP